MQQVLLVLRALQVLQEQPVLLGHKVLKEILATLDHKGLLASAVGLQCLICSILVQLLAYPWVVSRMVIELSIRIRGLPT